MPKLNRPYIGIDLGGTNIQVGVVDARNHVKGRAKKKTKAAEGGAKVLDRLVEGVLEACEDAKVKLTDIQGVGIGAPGAIDPKSGVVRQAPNLRWNDFPLARVLGRRLKQPVTVDNDVRAAIFGEWKLGAAKGVDDVLGVWIGTGVGGGLILRGQLYHGAFNTAGEVGHTTLFPFAPYAGGSLEDTCSRSAIVKRLVRLIETNHPSNIHELAGGDLSDVKAKVIAEAFKKNDKLTRRVIEQTADMMGVAIANFVTTLSLPRVVLGGGLTEAMGEDLVALVRASVRKHAYPDVCKAVEVFGTALESDAGLLGASLLARERAAKK